MTEAFSIATELLGPCVVTEISCGDRIGNGPGCFGSQPRSPCVAIGFFPSVGVFVAKEVLLS